MYLLKEEEELPIITSENFLPRQLVEDCFNDMYDAKQYFGVPSWRFGDNYDGDQDMASNDVSNPDSNKHLCWGSDLWIPDANIPVGPFLGNLERWFHHQGITRFMSECRSRELQLGGRMPLTGRTHIISYGDGGYYNWHADDFVAGLSIHGKDIATTPLFTISYTLVRDESLIEGGSQLFMHEGKTFEFPLKNNFLCIFPSRMFHACSEVKCDPNMPWENNRFNLQIWTARDDRF